jgi:hypothetical protein
MIAAKEYRWFLHPLDKLTNEIFCKQFDVSDVNSSDRLKNPVEVVMSDGKKRHINLIEVSQDQKNIAINAGKKSDLQFEIFVQVGGGQIRFCPKKYIEGTPVFEREFEGVSYGFGSHEDQDESA